MTDIAHYVINHDLEPAKTRGNEQTLLIFGLLKHKKRMYTGLKRDNY